MLDLLLLELLLEGDGDLLPLERRQHQDVVGLLLTLDDDGLEVLVGVKDLEGILGDSREERRGRLQSNIPLVQGDGLWVVLCRQLIQWAIDDGVQGLVHRVEGVHLLLLILDGQDHIVIILARDGFRVYDSYFSFINNEDIRVFRDNASSIN